MLASLEMLSAAWAANVAASGTWAAASRARHWPSSCARQSSLDKGKIVSQHMGGEHSDLAVCDLASRTREAPLKDR